MRAIVALCVVLFLVACGPLPRPFQPSEKSPPDAASLTFDARAGILVLPASDVPPAFAEALAQRTAQALQDHHIPASDRYANRASYRLAAEASGQDRLTWTLSAPGGAVVLGFEQAIDAAAWSQAAPSTLDPLAEEAATLIAALVEPEPAQAEMPTPGSTLAVQLVDGAPGDGRYSLAAAMRSALRRRGIAVDDALDGAAFVLLGSVYVEDAGPDEEAVAIEWTVMVPDGSRLGTVSQSNVVPAGVLDGNWGPVAAAVADDGAEGIVAMLSELGALTEESAGSGP